jgi:hypothetical protein
VTGAEITRAALVELEQALAASWARTSIAGRRR